MKRVYAVGLKTISNQSEGADILQVEECIFLSPMSAFTAYNSFPNSQQ